MKGTWLSQPQNGTVVIFVHGVMSDAEAWRNANGTYWPSLLTQDPRTRGVGVYIFEYETGLFSGTYRINDAVDALTNHLRLDKVLTAQRLIFVCHSMGGIVARRYLLREELDLLEAKIEIGLFLAASPSLGSEYATLLSPLSSVLFRHAQIDILRSSAMNAWLLDLDHDFKTLLNAKRLKIIGKELFEDKFIAKKFFLMRTVVDPISAARYFPEPYRVPLSTHFTIATPEDRNAIQHRLLVEFLGKLDPYVQADIEAVGKDGRIKVGFPDGVRADVVKCQLALKEVEGQLPGVLSVWPESTLALEKLVAGLLVEAAEHENPTSRFHGQPTETIRAFLDSGYGSTKNVARIRAGVDKRAELMVARMQGYWLPVLDNIVARSLSNFLTLCHLSALQDLSQLLASIDFLRKLIPADIEPWIYQSYSRDAYRQAFAIQQPLAYAKVDALSGVTLDHYRFYWGPESEVIESARRRDGDPVTGTWIDKYLYAQNELQLLKGDSAETFRYTEDVSIIRVTDSSGQERF
ncbi:alpha/beta fold hydrolase [Rhizobium laguerreae]|uniref:lipase family alpha/beta hydrolase n=1 Tax=Rhizobium laguerreae TaxID=1076926 RepID=UPI001C90B6AF|nr:alpha/beta hydrolase [Rhizobium laguerreae]MBY3531217.1 alpha/beta fold hydrolase [Rhizobium laguerreae]